MESVLGQPDSMLMKRDSINEDRRKPQPTSPQPNEFSPSLGEDSANRVLFFKKNKNFSYQNIAISPNYHMVVEQDHGLYPKISILSTQIPAPAPPPGSGLPTPHTKHGALALFRSPLDRNQTIQKERFTEGSFREDKSAFLSSTHKRTISEIVGGGNTSSRLGDSTLDHFTGVNSKYERTREPVNMGHMLSRGE